MAPTLDVLVLLNLERGAILGACLGQSVLQTSIQIHTFDKAKTVKEALLGFLESNNRPFLFV